MKHLVMLLIGLFACVNASLADDNIFLPTDDCLPDPVLDSLTIENGRIYVEDHVITTGELSYVMHKVNPTLYEKRKAGQKMYLISMGGIFLGTAAICTGSYWVNNFTGSRKDVGKGLLIAGVPVTAASVCTFSIGVAKTYKARKSFLRNCFGLAWVESVDMGVGANSVSVGLRF
ncbi:MAG: hypothetical protein MJZ02_02845 [Paludibacteraceae bacterium]|nr:hypothetical protein [Paludibacteraceae bacterium]